MNKLDGNVTSKIITFLKLDDIVNFVQSDNNLKHLYAIGDIKIPIFYIKSYINTSKDQIKRKNNHIKNLCTASIDLLAEYDKIKKEILRIK